MRTISTSTARCTLGLRVGQYTFDLEAGPEYRTQQGHFEIERHAEDTKRIEMHPFADLAKEGWYGGDLDVERRAVDLPLAMRSESLAYVPNRDDDGRERARGGAAWCLACRSRSTSKGKTSLEILREAKAAGAHVVARTPFAWDLPVWLASGELDAIELIHHHALRDGVVDNEDDGRPRDKTFFPGRNGNGRWSETVYYHVLNCGLRIPPAAGSGSGTNDSPVGTNRVYVYCGDEFSPERWWEGLEAGRVFVTNGPLLRPMVEGQPPGYVFHQDGGSAAGARNRPQPGDARAGRVPADHQERRRRAGSAARRVCEAGRQAAAGRRSTIAAGSWCGR